MFASLRISAACAVAAAILGLTVPALADSVGAYHIFATPAYRAKTGHAPKANAGPMEYFAGSVFSSAKVVSVIWGPNVSTTTVSDVPGFTSALVNSTFVDQLSEYDTFLKGVNGRHGTKQHITRGEFLGQIQIKPKDKRLNLTDKQVQKELEYQISKGVLPPNDLNTLYMVYFPSNISINLQGLMSCRDFGAYHFATSKKATESNIFYAVEPDCDGSFNSITFAASHEYAEATTDNIPTPGSTPKYPQAWNTSDGFEIADLCESHTGTLAVGAVHYLVTQYYLNSTGACSTGNYTSP